MGKLPTANTDGWPIQRAWFGEIDYSKNSVDASRGLISNYIEGNKKVLRCPSFDTTRVEALYAGETGGFGYNQNLGSLDYSTWPNPPVLRRREITDFPATSCTVVLTDSARIQLPWDGDPVLKATENYYLQGPDDPFAEPNTHFRHYGFANAAFLDGHVESLAEADVAAPGHWPEDAVRLKRELHMRFISNRSIDTYRPK